MSCEKILSGGFGFGVLVDDIRFNTDRLFSFAKTAPQYAKNIGICSDVDAAEFSRWSEEDKRDFFMELTGSEEFEECVAGILANVMSEREDVEFSYVHDETGGLDLVLVLAYCPWDTPDEHKKLTENGVRDTFEKYLSEISDDGDFPIQYWGFTEYTDPEMLV